ncbi:MAG: hypothetical protein Q9219_006379 [cf. Caloplaca sp. 3 TL-2023]
MSNDIEKNPSSTPEKRRKGDGQRSTPRRSESLKSTSSSRRVTQNEERDRGFNPTSTSYSSTTQNQYPGAASASIGSSYVTASGHPTNDSYIPPGLFRNASLADQLPRSTAGDDEPGVALDSVGKLEEDQEASLTMDPKRDREKPRGTHDRDGSRRDTKSSRDKKTQRDSDGRRERAMSTDEAAYIASRKRDRAATAAPGDPIGNSSFGQYSQPNQPQSHSSHVQDQFPGQFPSSSATPYRPPLAATEGGPGLAADYYGDAGQSVADQPGFRIQSPSLIVGAEPHLQPAAAVAAPPPEPSAFGGVGAAASFFDGSFNAGSDVEHHHSQKPTSTSASSTTQYSAAARPSTTYATSAAGLSNQHSSSVPIIPTIGAAAAGAAAGYYMSNSHSKPERPQHAPSSISGYGAAPGSSAYQQPAAIHDQHTSYHSSSRPPVQPGKPSSQSSNIPFYAAGAAGLAAAAHHHNNHESSHPHSLGQHYIGGSMAQQHRHRHRGPLTKLVDFFKDPEGVAQFEEYTEYIGVCRYCFAPGSSPQDAPRKHHYSKRRSNERFGSSTRIDKESRYWSSENESRRRKDKSWLEAGIAGYGLGKLGEGLFKQDHDFDDSRSVRSGRVVKPHRRRSSSSSLERKSRTSRGVINRSTDDLSRRSRSNDRRESGITSDGRIYRKDSHGNIETSTIKTHTSRHHSRSRSRSRDGKGRIADAALGATIGSSVISSTSHRRSRSPKKAFVRSKHGNEVDGSELASVLRLHDSEPHSGHYRSRHSPEGKHRHSRKKEKKSRGFFSFSNGSTSSSSSSNLAFGAELEHKPSRNKKTRPKNNRDTDAALLGLGAAAAAALALNQTQRSRHKGELIAVKEFKGKNRPGKHEHNGKKAPSSSEEDLWESASEGDWSSADSELAYGASLRRRSQESLSSDSSGLDKWSWRWGSKREKTKPTRNQRRSSGLDRISPAAGTPGAYPDPPQAPSDRHFQDSKITSSSSIPLQHVYPMPTSDPTQFDVARHSHDEFFHQPHVNGRPDPVPIQHPQPVAPVSPAVYTTQSPYHHSYSAPIGLPLSYDNQNSSTAVGDSRVPGRTKDEVPGAFPTGSEYFEPFMREPKKDPKPRRRDSSPTKHILESSFTSNGPPRRRKSLKDESSSVRFDLTKEQEDKDRREERRRQKEDDRRRERREREDMNPYKTSEPEFRDRRDKIFDESSMRARHASDEEPPNIKKEPWAAPAAAGIIAAAIGATVVAEASSKNERSDRNDEPRESRKDRDIEVIVKEHHTPTDETNSADIDRRGRSSKRDGISVWQAAAKLKRTSSHTEYAAFFTPPELLSKSSDVKQIVGANADNDITAYQVPKVVTVEPSEPLGHPPSRAFSFPITAEDMEHDKQTFPWPVPKLNLVEPTPPSSRAGSVAGSRSPNSRSPLSREVPVVDIPLEPLESLTDTNVSYAEPEHVEYTVIEPKERNSPPADSPVTEIHTSEAVPGISSFKNRKGRKKSPPETSYGDDLDFAATVAAGLQDTGFDPSIVIDDPSFRRRNSPPGSEGHGSPRVPTAIVTEITNDFADPQSPPHGFVEEIPEHHIPGSFDDDADRTIESRLNSKDVDLGTTSSFNDRNGFLDELTGPSDNDGVKPSVYSVEPVPPEPENLSNAAVDPLGDNQKGDNRYTGPQPTQSEDTIRKEATEPSDNAAVNPHVYTAEPESLESTTFRDVTIDPASGGQRSRPVEAGTVQTQSPVEDIAYSSPDKVDYPSDEAPSIAATAPVSSSGGQSSKSKKSKRRSVGFDDTASVSSSPATFGSAQEPRGKIEKAHKGGIFGLFGKSTENLSEAKGSRDTPVEANLEDFEEPKKRSKKSKSRKAALDDDEMETLAAEPSISQEAADPDEWSTTKKSKRGKEKRRASEGITAKDSGRITQDLPAQVIAPVSPGHDPLPSSSAMLTNFEDQEINRDRRRSDSVTRYDGLDNRSQVHDDQKPSFFGKRPEQPPLPDLPDASEDPGGQVAEFTMAERGEQPSDSRNESPATKADKQKWRLSDLSADGRSVSYSSPSHTAVPLRPLRFGRRPSSPGLPKSLPSTPQPSTTADPPFTTRRRERPHSTEFKSNEFRPIWLLEKHGSRQEPTPQETYPSLPSSHTTSRASSVHESDDTDRARIFDFVPHQTSEYAFIPEQRGLAIDTSRHEPDSELLDSQQATPTAHSFPSVLREENAGAEETIRGSEQMATGIDDGVSPVDVTAEPIGEPARDERLLHDVDELFPRRRSTSPSRYEAIVDTDVTQSKSDKPSPQDQSGGGGGIPSMLKDAALGAFVGGSAAALLRFSSQSDKLSEQPSKQTSVGSQIRNGDPDQVPPEEGPTRPTPEEMRMMQEQDAQDAVDSWFAPAQPKRTKSKKGKKRGQNSEELEQPTTVVQSSKSLEELPAVADDQASAAIDKQTGPILEDAALTAEPTQTIQAPLPEATGSEVNAEPAGVDWQAALTNRKDSKGKKKKNKKGADTWEDKSVLPEEPTAEQLSKPPMTLERGLDPKYAAAKDILPTTSDTLDTPVDTTGKLELAPEAEIALLGAEPGDEFTSTKRNRKGKKKNRRSSFADSTEAALSKDILAAQMSEESAVKDLGDSIEQPRLAGALSVEESRPKSVVAETPYEFPPRENEESEAPKDPLLPADQSPASQAIQVVSEPIVPAQETIDEAAQMPASGFSTEVDHAHHRIPDGVPEHANASVVEPIGDRTPPSQETRLTGLESQISPEKVPLPLGDDFDLNQTPPDSPVIQPIDVNQKVIVPPTSTSEKLGEEAQKDEIYTTPSASIREPSGSSPSLDDPTPLPAVLVTAISDLNLPEKATPDQTAEPAVSLSEVQIEVPREQQEDDLPTFSTKRSKKGKKGRKNKAFEVDTEADLGELQISAAANTAAQRPGDSLHDQNTSTTRDLSEFGGSRLEQVAVQEAGQVDNGQEAGRTITKQSPEAIEESTEWPTATKKTKKGKKGKKVQFDEPQAIQTPEPGASAFSNFLPATTSTAEDIENLLQTSDSERAGTFEEHSTAQEVPAVAPALNTLSDERFTLSREEQGTASPLEPEDPHRQNIDAGGPAIQSMDVAEASPPLQVDTAHAVTDQLPEFQEQALPEGKLLISEGQETASTDTTVAIQDMLEQQKQQEASRAPDQLAFEDQLQPTEVDEFAWAPTKKKKKGKKSKSADEISNTIIDNSVPLEPPGTAQGEALKPAATLVDEPTEDFPVKKPKKDKKNKRKTLSRSVSDLEGEVLQSTPPSMPESREEETAVSDAAPLVPEESDQPMDSKTVHAEAASKPIAQTKSDELPVPKDTPHGPAKVEEMEMSAAAPSITEKQDEPSSIALPLSPDAVEVESWPTEPDRPAPLSTREEVFESPTAKPRAVSVPLSDIGTSEVPIAAETFVPNTEDATIHDIVQPVPKIDGQPLNGELSTALAPADVFLPSESKIIGQSTGEENIEKAIASAPKDEEPIFEPSTSRKDKEEVQKAKAPPLDSEPVIEERGYISQPDNTIADVTGDLTVEPALETPAVTKENEDDFRAKSFDWNKGDSLAALEDPDNIIETRGQEPSGTAHSPEGHAQGTAPVVTEEKAEDQSAIENPEEQFEKAKALAIEGDPPEPASEPTVEALKGQEKILDSASEQLADLPTEEEATFVPGSFPKSKKDKKKAKKSKILARGDDAPEASTATSESQQEDATKEPVPPVADESSPALQEPPKSKKDKKKAKKSKAETWEDGFAETPVVSEEPQRDPAKIEDEQPAADVVEGIQETVAEPFRSKKDKKKAKKAKASARDDVEPQQDAIAREVAAVDEQSKDMPEAPIEETVEIPLDEQPSTKKAKKKGKKSKWDGGGEKPSIPPPGDDKGRSLPTLADDKMVAEPSFEAEEVLEEPALEVPKDQVETTEKSKKKGKKSKIVALEEKPEIPSRDETDEVMMPISIEDDTVPLPPENVEEVRGERMGETPVEAPTEETPEDQVIPKKKKSKKSNFVSWDDEESSAPSPRDDEIPVSTGAGIKVELPKEIEDIQREPVEETPAVEEPVIETFDDQPIAKKSKKKSKKARFMAFDEEASSIPSSRDEGAISLAGTEPPPVEVTSEVPITKETEMAEDEEASATTAKSRQDKKKTKKSRASPWEETAPVVPVEPPVADPSQGLDDFPTEPVGSSEAEVPREISEPVLEPQPEDTTAHVEGPPRSQLNEPAAGAEQDNLLPAADLNLHHAQTIAAPLAKADKIGESVPALPDNRTTADYDSSTTARHDDAGPKHAPDVTKSTPLTPPVQDPSSSPTHNQTPQTESVPVPTIDNALEAAEEVIPPILVEQAADPSPTPEIPATESSMPQVDTFLDASSKPHVAPTEAEPAPSTSDALEVTEEVIPLPPNEEVYDTFSRSEGIVREDSKLIAAFTTGDALRSAEEQISPIPQDQDKRETRFAEESLEQPVQSALDPEAENTALAAEFPTTSKKDKKKAKKAKKAMASEDEPTGVELETPITDDPEASTELEAEGGILDPAAAEEPSLLPESNVSAIVEEVPTLSKKDKRKAKKAKKSSSFEEEPSEGSTPMDPEPAPQISPQDQAVIEEPRVPEVVDDLQATSRKDKKKSKKNKKALDFDPEPPESAAVAESEPLGKAVSEEPTLAVDPSTAEIADDFQSLGKKDRKKAKKAKKGSMAEDGLPGGITPVEPDVTMEAVGGEVEDEQPVVAIPASADDLPTTSKKDKKSKKKQKESAFDDKEPPRIATPVIPILGLGALDQLARAPSNLAEPPVMVEADDDTISSSKKDRKKAKKNKKGVVFDDEPSEPTTPAELEPLAAPLHEVAEAIPSSAEASTFAEELAITIGNGEKKKGKKGKKAVAFDDEEPSENTTPAEPGAVPDVGEGSSVPVEIGAVAAVDDIRAASKEERKAKKGRKASTFGDDEPSKVVVVSSELDRDVGDMDQTAKEPTSPAETSAFETSEGVLPLSEKDKKKAKKVQKSDWGTDEGIVDPASSARRATNQSPSTEPRQLGTANDQVIEDIEDMSEQDNLGATLSQPTETEQTQPIVEPTLPSSNVEYDLAPRHQTPTAVLGTTRLPSAELPIAEEVHSRPGTPKAAPSPVPETPSRSPIAVALSPVSHDQMQTSISTEQEEAANAAPPSAETLTSQNNDDFASFATTKKSEKGKKAKKLPMAWEEDDTASPSGSMPELSQTVDEVSAPIRPEMAAWPTEVRLNQSKVATQAEEQPGDPVSLGNDSPMVDALSPVPEPMEPPPVVDERSDYFSPSVPHDVPIEPQPFEPESAEPLTAPASEAVYEGMRPQTEAPAVYDEVPTVATPSDATKKQANAPQSATEQTRSQAAATVEPADDFQGFAPKKDKKSKRKQKKQAIDDVMWEFPTMKPSTPPPPGMEQIVSGQASSTRDPSVDVERPGEISTASASEGQFLGEPPVHAEEKLSSEIGSQGAEDLSVAAGNLLPIQYEPTIPEEPRLEEAAEDEWGSVPKKGKKGKKSKKSKAVEAEAVLSPEPTSIRETEAAEAFENRALNSKEPEHQQPEHHDEDHPSTLPTGAGEGVAGAAVMAAGVIAAEQLGRKESKKGKKSKKNRQGSSAWDVPEQETQIPPQPSGEEVNQQVQAQASTPERRRSPIQAWHQYISPSHSPKQSELYEVQEDRPRSAGSTRRKRSQVTTPERRSPTEAWHQFNTPRHSPQQSELYDYEDKQTDRHPAPKATNRDSAVHVLDSPMVSEKSPVRRVMRDSGYPDTEASPVVGSGNEYHQQPEDVSRGSDGFADAAHGSKQATPLATTSEGQDVSEEKEEEPLPHWEGEHQDFNLPGRVTQPMRPLDDLREPSPVSSTSKDRSSVLFDSSPSNREEQSNREGQRASRHRESLNTHEHDHGSRHDQQAASRSLEPSDEDHTAMVKARAESLAALSGLRETSNSQPRPSLFGGPIGASSDGHLPETPLDHNRQRLNTITEYSPEESPLHNRNRDLSDVGSPDRGVKTARRSGTPQAIQKRRTISPPTEQSKRMASADDPASRLFPSAVAEERYHGDMERSRSRGTEQRPSSRQSNISSLVSGQPKQREYERRSLSGASNHSIESINAIIRTPPDQMRSASGMSNRSSGTPPLRRTDRSVSGDLRGANRKSDAKKRERANQTGAELELVTPEAAVPTSSTTTHDSTKAGGRSRVREMADVYEGYGDFHGSPISPTRPPSMRRRQSMQVLELESKLDQLVSENRALHDARQRAERNLEDAAHDRGQEIDSYREGIETRDTWLRQKDTEIMRLNETIENLQNQLEHLTEVSDSLQHTSRELGDHRERYGQLEAEHADTHQRWQQSIVDLEALKSQHAQLSSGMEDIVGREVAAAVEAKDAELHRLSSDLDTAKQQIRSLQQEILAAHHNRSSSNTEDDSIIPDRDEDYFDAQCQSLCQHVQQWVLRFSKFSDTRACYLAASEIRDEKILDRIENAVLDGSDPDAYLADRVRRRDVFMSIVMTMLWEFIFTRYLFGADREQRQKLKSLEKQLAESRGVPLDAVQKWRATTLVLLSKREPFLHQRAQDTEAVMHSVFDTLAAILPPPQHLIPQIQQSLRKVLASAVDLSIEMRTQRAEYVMLPPLQPEYDLHGDLARKVHFNAALMCEAGGGGGPGGGIGSSSGRLSPETLEGRGAVVRTVLFPLVVRKGGGAQVEPRDSGAAAGEEIVVFPARVLVHVSSSSSTNNNPAKRARVISPSEQGASDVGMVEGGMF